MALHAGLDHAAPERSGGDGLDLVSREPAIALDRHGDRLYLAPMLDREIQRLAPCQKQNIVGAGGVDGQGEAGSLGEVRCLVLVEVPGGNGVRRGWPTEAVALDGHNAPVADGDVCHDLAAGTSTRG